MRLSRRNSSPPKSAQIRTARGFTLVELAITVVVLSVLLALAAPLFTGMSNSNRLTSNANEIVAAMQIARSEAVRRNAPTFFCQSTNGTTCSNVSPWQGWLVYADADRDSVAGADEIVRAGVIEAPMQIIASPSVTNSEMVFRADGLAYTTGNNLLEANVRVCLPVTDPQLNVRDVNISIGGRVTVRPPIDESGACPIPADN
ncbi:MAG: GspH/FimT family pseudopilin [Lysobacteraceae bacterium]